MASRKSMEKKKQQMGRKFWVAPKDVQETRQRSSMPSLLLPLSLASCCCATQSLALRYRVRISSDWIRVHPGPTNDGPSPTSSFSLCLFSLCDSRELLKLWSGTWAIFGDGSRFYLCLCASRELLKLWSGTWAISSVMGLGFVTSQSFWRRSMHPPSNFFHLWNALLMDRQIYTEAAAVFFFSEWTQPLGFCTWVFHSSGFDGEFHPWGK